MAVGAASIAYGSLQAVSRRDTSEVMAYSAIGQAGYVLLAFGVGGPLGSFEPFSDVSTGVMIVLMWLGRLEVIPIVVLLSRHYWRNA